MAATVQVIMMTQQQHAFVHMPLAKLIALHALCKSTSSQQLYCSTGINWSTSLSLSRRSCFCQANQLTSIFAVRTTVSQHTPVTVFAYAY